VKASDFFSKEEKEQLMSAIAKAELQTSGEIRIHIESSCKIDVLDRAAFIFKKLKMHMTNLRNGVLIYLAIEDRKFAIIGDAGINKVVPTNFWDDIKNIMANHFQKGEFVEGLTHGTLMAGEQLKKNFPHQEDDINELSNDISFN
jgi:uncharacterized membrane protein